MNATEQNLENALNNTLALITNLNARKFTLEADLTDANRRLLDATQMLNATTINIVINAALEVVATIESQISAIQTELTTVNNNLQVAVNQAETDQAAIRNYKISNYTPEELAEFLSVEQKAEESKSLFKYKTQILVLIGVIAFLVGLLFLFKWLKKKKLVGKSN